MFDPLKKVVNKVVNCVQDGAITSEKNESYNLYESKDSVICAFAQGFENYGDIGLPVVLDKIIFKNCFGKVGQYLSTALSVCITDVMVKTLLVTTNSICKIKEFNEKVFFTASKA